MRLKLKALPALALMSILLYSPLIATGYVDGTQKKDKGDKPKKQKEEKKKEAESGGAKEARPVMWEEPSDIENRDLFYGPGGAEGAPDANGKFTFEARSTKGTSEKIDVVDDKGRKWKVKFGPEAKPETAATRIVWAAGYHVDQDYFVKRTHIEGRGGFDDDEPSSRHVSQSRGQRSAAGSPGRNREPDFCREHARGSVRDAGRRAGVARRHGRIRQRGSLAAAAPVRG